MRKCVSAPNLVELGTPASSTNATFTFIKSGSAPNLQQQPKARNVSTKAGVPLMDMVSTIYQVDSMITSPISQHLKCAFTHPHQFPKHILDKSDQEFTKDMALCEAEPNEVNEEKEPRYTPRNRLFLSRCSSDLELSERYAAHVLRQRKLKYTKQ